MSNPTIKFKRGSQSNFASVGLNTGEPAFITDQFNFYIGLDGTTSNNKYFGSSRYWTKETNDTGSGVNLVEGLSNGSHYITLAAPVSVGAAVTYYFPATQGSANSVLTNDGSGNLTWGSGSANPIFTGISTFSDTTDSATYNDGAVQIKGGLGIVKNLNVGGNLNITGVSTFIGTCTFQGGTINLGDSDTDDIVVAGEFKSNLVPSDDNSYSIGASGKRWKGANFAGVGTFGALDVNGATNITGKVEIYNDLNVTGNVTVGGTSYTISSTEVVIASRDILLGLSTSSSPTDDTANHGGVAIASTEGTSLVSLQVVGINTFPDTYKQMMWVKGGTMGGGTADAWLFNYGVGIGSTQVPSGVYLAVGGIQATSTNLTVPGHIKTGTIKAADDQTNITLTSNTLTAFSGDIKVGGNTIQASDGTDAVELSGANVEVKGDLQVTGNDIKSGAGSTAITLSSTDVEVKGDLQVTGNDIKSSTGNTAITLSDTSVTIAGDLYVSGSTTQVNTTSLTVEDNLIELAKINGSAPGSDLNVDVGMLLHYYDSAARLGAVYWDDSAARLVLAARVTESSGVLTVDSGYYADVEFKGLYITDTAGTADPIITYTSIGGVTGRHLQNVIIDGGTF